MEPAEFFALAGLVAALMVFVRLAVQPRCPHCRSMVGREASVCRRCGRELEG